MRKIAFFAHDPGGCEAIYPVFKKMEKDAILLTLGPSATKYCDNAVGIDEWKEILQGMHDNNDLAGVVLGRDWGTDLDVQILSWTRRHKVKSIVILDYWSNYATAFRDSERQYWPDAYFVMDELARRDAIAEGVPENILRVVGQPGLDKFCAMDESHSKRNRDVLFLSQPLSMLYGDKLGYTEQKVLVDVHRACKECGRKLDVKFHPKDGEIFQKKYSHIAVNGDVDEMMRNYSLVIGMTTMALLHAALMRVPIVSYQPGLKVQDGCITNRLGLSKALYCYEDLLAVLSDEADVIIDKELKSAVKPIWMDGCSTFRATEAVKEVFGV